MVASRPQLWFLRLGLMAFLAACAAGCASAASDGSDGSDVSEGALIPAKAFSAKCDVTMPKDDGTTTSATVSGRFLVANDGTLSAADRAPIHVIKDGDDTKVTLKTGRVIDAEKDIFEVSASYGIFTVGVHYDGSHKNAKNVRITMPMKGEQTYDGVCRFTDESGNDADGKVK